LGHRTASEGYRVLITAPFGRDAESLRALLADQGYAAHVQAELTGLAAAIDAETGAVLVTEEAFRADMAPLEAVLDAQPAWSDVPFVILAARRTGGTRADEAIRARLAGLVSNAIVLERPIGSASLTSAVASAMRLRQKQFEMRDRLAEVAAQADRLAGQNAELTASADALRDSERRFEAIANSIDQMVWSTLPDGFHDYYNDRWYEYTGVPRGSTNGEAWEGLFHPDDRERTRSVWRRCLATGEPYHIEHRLRHSGGDYRWVLGRAQPVRDGAGRIVRWFGTCTDIDDLIHAREVMARSRAELEAMVADRTRELERHSAERERAETALRQSQKMEAVGQLTGGIAHDFNNMLTGVIGALDIIKRRIAGKRFDDLDRFMDAASASAQRAAGLTARLLAFSRRQSLNPKPLDANRLLLGLEDLLRRTMHENIALRIMGGDAVPLAVADANQLENAVLNLAINARDAMPEGGQLTIETKAVDLDQLYSEARPEVKPGRYVVVAVSDTGVGMSPEILDKAFDPFFTTKPIGQGTGLGLSMIYGFARQSGGQVRVHSKPGIGTTVSLYLPASQEAAVEESSRPAPVPEGQGQNVLLVEDDPSVRLLVREVLEELSYRAIEAKEATGAIPILASDAPIDLMISDVGLPGMSGRQLAEVARHHRPDLPVLFITGYAENAAIRAGFLGTNMAMITKPFALDELAAKIAEMLAREAAA